jgi:uncharacterized RDD family membrane protein YckC
MNWYYVENGQQSGPVTDAQLEELRLAGTITPDTLVWREGMSDWQPYRDVKVVAEPPPHAPAPPQSTEAAAGAAPLPGGLVCAECGQAFPPDQMIRHGNVFICAGCKPVFLQKLGEGAKIQTGTLNYAGFWIRFGAKVIDNLILGLAIFVPIFVLVFVFAFKSAAGASLGIEGRPTVLGATGNEFEMFANIVSIFGQLVFIAVNCAYTIFFLGKYGATPGKMLCKIQVVTADGGKITYGRATGRYFGELLSGMICNIGYIIAAFDDQKRTLHDHICNTRVVYK